MEKNIGCIKAFAFLNLEKGINLTALKIIFLLPKAQKKTANLLRIHILKNARTHTPPTPTVVFVCMCKEITKV